MDGPSDPGEDDLSFLGQDDGAQGDFDIFEDGVETERGPRFFGRLWSSTVGRLFNRGPRSPADPDEVIIPGQ